MTFAGDCIEWLLITHRLMIVTGVDQSIHPSSPRPKESLTDVFVRKLMGEPDSLWLMLHRSSIHDGLLELLNDGFMNGVALPIVS